MKRKQLQIILAITLVLANQPQAKKRVESKPAESGDAVVVDLLKGAISGVKLGASLRRLRKAIGDPVSQEVSPREYLVHHDWRSLGLTCDTVLQRLGSCEAYFWIYYQGSTTPSSLNTYPRLPRGSDYEGIVSVLGLPDADVTRDVDRFLFYRRKSCCVVLRMDRQFHPGLSSLSVWSYEFLRKIGAGLEIIEQGCKRQRR